MAQDLKARRRKILSHMVWLDRFEMSVILDALDYYENEAKARLERNPGKHANLLNVREKIAIARFGKIRRTDMPAIRDGKRIPHTRKHKVKA
jgi:hypothetical protein